MNHSKNNPSSSFWPWSLITSLVFTCLSFPIAAQKTSRQIKVEPGDQYLNFPIGGWSNESDTDHKMMDIIHEGKVLDEFSISLANHDPDWWAFFPLDQY